jgi:hypothetical protein
MSEKKVLIPEVVDDQGKPVVGPDLDAVLKKVTELAQLANMVKIRTLLEKQWNKGKDTEITFNTNSSPQLYDLRIQYPFEPLVIMNFVNRGGKNGYISINSKDNYKILAPGEVWGVDHTLSEEKIHYLWYKCAEGTSDTTTITAAVRY